MPELPPQRPGADSGPEPGRVSLILSALAVVVFTLGLGAWIEWRSAPPPPPALPSVSLPARSP